jgi:putative FmdB family regulatory protein
MPAYTYMCDSCKNIFDVIMGSDLVMQTYICPKCNSISKRLFTAPYINTGAKSRIFYQWKGDPDKCPSDLRDALKKQDMPSGVKEFHKEGEPVLGTGDKFKERR